MSHDDERTAEQSTRELAAVTSAELCRDVRAAMAGVIAAVQQWLGSAGPPLGHSDTELVDATDAMHRDAGAVTGDDRSALMALQRAAGPVLGGFVADPTPHAAAVRAAVERLRWAAKTRPALVQESRVVTGQPEL